MPKAYIGTKQAKLFVGNKKVKYVYIGDSKVYSAGNLVTYKVDSNTTYTEEVDNEATCLSPKTFTPSKNGWTFVGWREDNTASSTVLNSKNMGDEPITLYAVFKQGVTLTLYNNSSSPSTQSGSRYYNNSKENNPSFKLTQNTASGWSALGWCSSNGATAAVSVENGGTVTLAADATYYGKYSQTITLSYNGNGATGGSTASQTGTRYYNSGNYSNPSFTIRNNGFSRNSWNFSKWALNGTGGTQYNSGNSISLSSSATLYALWYRSSSTSPSINLSKTSSDYYSSNGSAPSITVSGGTIKAHWNNVSWCGITVDAWTSNAMDLSGYNTAVISCYSGVDTKEMTVGFGTTKGTFSVSGSPALKTTANITLNISNLSSAYFGVHWNATENPNYSTARDYDAAIKSITLKP